MKCLQLYKKLLQPIKIFNRKNSVKNLASKPKYIYSTILFVIRISLYFLTAK